MPAVMPLVMAIKKPNQVGLDKDQSTVNAAAVLSHARI